MRNFESSRWIWKYDVIKMTVMCLYHYGRTHGHKFILRLESSRQYTIALIFVHCKLSLKKNLNCMHYGPLKRGFNLHAAIPTLNLVRQSPKCWLKSKVHGSIIHSKLAAIHSLEHYVILLQDATCTLNVQYTVLSVC